MNIKRSIRLIIFLFFALILFSDNIKNVLKRYADTDDRFYEKDDEANTTSSQEIIKGFKDKKLTDEDRKKYSSWLKRMAEKRVDHIVSNKYRNAYQRAAETMVAYAESLTLNQQDQKGREFIIEFYHQRYRRYPAFRNEVKQMVKSSDVLNSKCPTNPC